MSFSSKAKKNEAVKDVSRAFEKNVHDKLHRLTLDLSIECRDKGDKENEERYHELYWSIPDLHNWREKHSKMFAEFAEIVEEAESLFETRKAIKETEVAPKAEKTVDPREEKVYKSIADEMEARKASYVRGLSLAEIFGGLNVTANSHMVTNSHGTTFPRTFFYLFGKLTALNVIIAVHEKMESEKEV